MIVLDLSILNQKGTPMFNSDTFANRPAFGIVGRIFISTDTAAIYRDTGTAWDLIADGGSASTNIYNSNGTLSADRTVASGGFNLTFNPATVFDTTLTAANNASSLALFGVNRLSYAAAFSANNIGALYGGGSFFALQTFAGSATFANSNVASGGSSVNSIDFSSGGSTITMTQSSGIRVMSGQQNLFQYQGTNSGTITHAAISQNTGFYRPSAATGILTITNAYSHLINALDDYGSGFTFTNRWGIYQAGSSDVNYFAANSLFGTTVNAGFRVDISGNARVKGQTTLSGTTNNDTTNIFKVEQNNGNGRFLVNALGQVIIAGDANTSTENFVSIERNSFNPTSGTNTHTSLFIAPNINQTGTASGQTIGLYIRPTLTSAPNWTAFVVSAGVSILAPSSTASATLRIPSGTAPTTPVNGDIFFDGTNLFMRVGGVTKTFTLI